MWNNWSELVSYPRNVSVRTRELLNELNSIIPVPDSGDRYVDLSDFLSNGLSSGLITEAEYHRSRSDIGPHM